ncbi:matrix metalloproteinase-17 [Marmota marmota marmota]|uniref:matrix metalloproteinase-17 n=1 Tax=Marmota marmota marmota TaxID=9994 RepID=UPI00209244D1|nr:matrix metalloproteinase-17 [Marmota marmota marmota]
MGRRAARGPGPPLVGLRLLPLLLLLLALAARGGCAAPAPRAEDLSLGVEWLSRFGYLPPADPATGRLQTQEELSKAIATMQQFGGLKATGILDEATLALMKTPRCSLPDLPPLSWARRKRQAPAPTKWNKRNLSWRWVTRPGEGHWAEARIRGCVAWHLLPTWPSSRRPRKDVPHRCSAHFDAVAQIRGEAFFFKGKYFWRLNRDRHLVSLQPAQMHHFWRGLPLHLDSVDAVYERTSDHKIVFFKGDRYWVFKDNNVEEGYPRPISDFSLPPGGVDAAFSWPHNDRTYFFKDQLYWRYDDHTRRMDPGYPAQGPLWRGVPSTLDDAMRWSDGASYFFRGQEYWKVQEGELEAAPGYPQSTARDWLVCGEPAAGEAEAEAARAQDGLAVCSCSSAAPAPSASPPPPQLLLLCALGAARAGAR